MQQCVLGFGAACTRAAPLLQTKTHHETQEFKSLQTEKLNFPSPGAADLLAPGDQPTPSCFTIAEKPQKKKKKNPEKQPNPSGETGKRLLQKSQIQKGKKISKPIKPYSDCSSN